MTSRINAMLSAMLYCKVASSAGLLVRPAMNQTLLESLRQTIAYAPKGSTCLVTDAPSLRRADRLPGGTTGHVRRFRYIGQ